uniref:Uncharacterized protein n=1 Tax=Salarias fasciatus TaxID=181472 RepID=A0A672HF35_SALFA
SFKTTVKQFCGISWTSRWTALAFPIINFTQATDPALAPFSSPSRPVTDNSTHKHTLVPKWLHLRFSVTKSSFNLISSFFLLPLDSDSSCTNNCFVISCFTSCNT